MTDQPLESLTEHLTHPKYRADIDGLRAIAVLSVVGFHAFPNWFKGGFIGVDIFFVISGFLISTIIFGNLERDSFSFVEFYSRRIKRIFPALLLVLIASFSFSFGWFQLLAEEYKQLGKHIVGGAGFVSNLILWGESGYFDNAAETKPLLHLWSLAIEEQFYILWPLLLAFVWKRKWSFLTITAIIALISFSLNIYAINGNPTAAFYSPLTRFWELMIGGLLAYIALHRPNLNKKYKNAQSLLGLITLLLGLLVINRESAFPGWWALLPTFGAFFIISAGPDALLNKKILANKVLVWVGLISYPLYLWHWPLLSYIRIVELGTPTRSMRIFVVFISILLAWLTYRLIERPIRFGKQGKTITLSLLVLMVSVGFMGNLCYRQGGFNGTGFRAPEKLEFSEYFDNSLSQQKYFQVNEIAKKYRFECEFYDIEKFRDGKATRLPRTEIDKSCFERNSAFQNAVLIWGDSHAEQLYFGLKSNLPPNWQILQIASSGCSPNITIKEPSTTDYCDQSNWFALKTLRETKPNVVIMVLSH
jgi:peptidoglycan/LPS O-acetylase OafA/YrhL